MRPGSWTWVCGSAVAADTSSGSSGGRCCWSGLSGPSVPAGSETSRLPRGPPCRQQALASVPASVSRIFRDVGLRATVCLVCHGHGRRLRGHINVGAETEADDDQGILLSPAPPIELAATATRDSDESALAIRPSSGLCWPHLLAAFVDRSTNAQPRQGII